MKASACRVCLGRWLSVAEQRTRGEKERQAGKGGRGEPSTYAAPPSTLSVGLGGGLCRLLGRGQLWPDSNCRKITRAEGGCGLHERKLEAGK